MEEHEDATSNDMEASGAEDDNVLVNMYPGEKKYRVLKSVFMASIWLCIGTTGSIIQPTIIDLKELVNANYEEISRILVGKSAGYLVGSLVGGALLDKFRRHIDLVIGIDLLLIGVSTAAIPWSPNLGVMALIMAIGGVAQSCLSAAGNTVIMMMWGEKSAFPLHCLHLGYGVGSMIIPLMVYPFLSPTAPAGNTTIGEDHQQYTLGNSQYGIPGAFPVQSLDYGVYMDHNNYTNGSSSNGTQIYIPYGMIGGLSLIFSVIFFVYYCLKLPMFMIARIPKKSWKDVFSPKACTGGQSGYGVFMLIMLFLMYLALVGKDCAWGTFIVPLAVDVETLKFDKKTAVIISTANAGSYLMGRLTATFLVHFIPIHLLLFSEIVCNCIVAGLMPFFALKTQTLYWVFSLVFGFFAGPIYPGGMAWADSYIEVSAMVVAIIDIGIGLGALVVPWLSGYLYQYYQKVDVIYLTTGCSGALLAIMILLQIVASSKGNRFENQRAQRTEQDEGADERSPLIN